MTIQERIDKFISRAERKRYFELEDIDIIDKDLKLIFVLSKKNIGKTYQIMKLIRSYTNNNKRFVYCRFSRSELNITRNTWNTDPEMPFWIDSKDFIFKKIWNEEKKKWEVPNNSKDVEKKGICFIFKNLQNSASAENGFENYDRIIFDEIIPLNPKELTQRLVLNFISFYSNVLRNKKEFQVLMFGNNNGDNLLYSLFKVDTSNYVDYREEDKMLFLNLKNLYSGISEQKEIQAFDKYAKDLIDAFNNNEYVSIVDRTKEDLNIKNWKHFISIVSNNSTISFYTIDYINPHLDLHQKLWYLKTEWAITSKTIDRKIKNGELIVAANLNAQIQNPKLKILKNNNKLNLLKILTLPNLIIDNERSLDIATSLLK